VHAGRHEVTQQLVLSPTTDLELEAGVTIALGDGIGINAQRDVKALGTEESPILFTWLTEGKYWTSLMLVEPNSQQNVFEYVIFEHGYESQFNELAVRGALGLWYAKARISHCTFRNNQGDDGLTLKYSDSLVEYSSFLNNASDAIDEGNSHTEIAFSYFEGNGNDGVDLGDKSSAHVHDNVMYKNRDKGVSVGEGCVEPKVEHNLIVGNATGIAVKDGSTPIIWNNTLYGNDVGFACYESVADAGSGKGSFTSGIIWSSVAADLDLQDCQTVFSYSCIQRVTDVAGTQLVDGIGITSPGNGCDDPLFVDPANQDFHLLSVVGRWDPNALGWVADAQTSPCIDGGDLAADPSLEPAPNGSRVNMGRYGGTAEASKSSASP